MVQTSPWILTAASTSTLLLGMRVASSSAWRPTLLATPPGGSSSPFMVNPHHTGSCKNQPAAHQIPPTIHAFGSAVSLTRCTPVGLLPVSTVRPRSNGGGPGSSAEPIRMSAIEGEDALLPCEVHSVPPPTISWAREKHLISPFSPR